MDRNQFINWVNDRNTTPEDIAYATKAGLKRVAQFEQAHRQRFVGDIGNDATLSPLLDELKTPA